MITCLAAKSHSLYCLGASCIVNHNAFGAVRLKMASLGFGNMHICCGTKGSEMTERGFTAIPRFKRSEMGSADVGAQL